MLRIGFSVVTRYGASSASKFNDLSVVLVSSNAYTIYGKMLDV